MIHNNSLCEYTLYFYSSLPFKVYCRTIVRVAETAYYFDGTLFQFSEPVCDLEMEMIGCG